VRSKYSQRIILKSIAWLICQKGIYWGWLHPKGYTFTIPTPYQKLMFVDVGTRALSIAFSPDGELLGIGANDTIRLWRVSNGLEVQNLKGHMGEISSLAFSPDGSFLASGSSDGTVKLWQDF
jgi:WD40 repeat protein